MPVQVGTNVRSVTQSRSGAAAVNPHSGTRPYQTPDESARLLAPTRLGRVSKVVSDEGVAAGVSVLTVGGLPG